MAAFLAAPLLCLAPETQSSSTFEPTDCWVPLPEDTEIQCGTVSVPLRWEAPETGRIKLAVALYPARDPVPGAAPVIYLSGGPGFPALGPDGENIAGWRGGADRLFPGRTVVVFDQRGTGLSQPRLDCPEIDSPTVWGELSEDPEAFGDSRARLHGALAACHRRLSAEGTDLNAFNRRQSAADVEGLRRALGFNKVVLSGLSYGTRLALTVLRHYPESLAAVVLDSPFPPQALWPGEDGEALGATLERLFAACARDQRCAKAYPDLRGRLLTALARLEAKPAVIEVANLESTTPLYARVDHRVFLGVLWKEMYYTGRLVGLPTLISGVAKGEDWRIKRHLENVYYGPEPRIYDSGMTYAFYCHDKAGVEPRPSDLDGSGPYPYVTDFIAWNWQMDFCRTWPHGALDPIEHSAVTSDLPVLLLAGALDGSTAVELAEQAAATLANGHLFVFPANAHVQLFGGDCPRQILSAFLADPLTRPNPACLAKLPQPTFRTLGGS
ncbi:MAG: alpha/beta fold hydrolase [Pseudomonadota bacterium]